MCCRAISSSLWGIFLCFWKRKEHISHSLKVLADTSEREFIAVNHLVAVLLVCEMTQKEMPQLFMQSGGERTFCTLVVAGCVRLG